MCIGTFIHVNLIKYQTSKLYEVNKQTYYAFFIRKNNQISLIETRTLMKVHYYDDVVSQSITGTVELSTNDYIEIFVQRVAGNPPNNTDLVVFSLNLRIR